MGLIGRLLRGLWAFGWIFADYLVQMGLAKLTRRTEVSPETGRRTERYPSWVRARRERIDERNAKRALRAMLRLRGVYIKLGQVLSVMGGFLPRPYIREMETLQDAVPPLEFSALREAFTRTLGTTPDDAFQHIDAQPLAAASLGQVYVAQLHDGRKVAVKILYPGIRDVIRTDMRVVAVMVRVYKFFVPVQGIESVHASLVDLLRRETDYRHEAECMTRMAANFADEEDILFPDVVDELTSTDVLTMTFMEGVKITKLDELRAMGIDTTRMAERLVQSFYKQLFVDRFFHADPHPGNFLIQKGEGDRARIVVLDFGAISEAREDLIDGLIDVLEGMLGEDPDKVLGGFEHMGFVAEGADRAQLRKVAMQYFQKLMQIEDRSPGAFMKRDREELRRLADPGLARDEIRELMKSVAYPDTWFYVERATLLLLWLTASIDPSIDTMRVGVPYVLPLVMERNKKRAQERKRTQQRDAETEPGPADRPDGRSSGTARSQPFSGR